jgi:hypothetical protein
MVCDTVFHLPTRLWAKMLVAKNMKMIGTVIFMVMARFFLDFFNYKKAILANHTGLTRLLSCSCACINTTQTCIH